TLFHVNAVVFAGLLLRTILVIFSTLAALFGPVPARYSCALLMPSPSGSALALTFVVPKFCSSHGTGRPLGASAPFRIVSVCTTANALLNEIQPQFAL